MFYINRYLCIKSFKISINSVIAIFKSQKCIYSQKSMQCSLFHIQLTAVQKKSCLNESQKGCQTLTACTELRVYDALCTILYHTNTTIGYIYIFTTTLTLLCASSLYRMHIAHVTAALALTLPLFCCNRKTRKCFFPV